MVIPAPPYRLPEVHLINPWLLGEECTPIIIRDANKTFHFIFPGTFTRRMLGRLVRRLLGGLARLGRGLPASGVAY
jgi:hypothetical protein